MTWTRHLAIALVLALSACGRDPYAPFHGDTPLRPGSLEELVVPLPLIGALSDWSTHYRRDDWLLVRLSLDNSSALAVVDASEGTLTTYCNRVYGGYDGPLNLMWTEDVGAWDLLDGRLMLNTTDDAIASCGVDGEVERIPLDINPWSATKVLVDGGFVTWRRDAAQPSRFAWVDGAETPVAYSGPEPLLVVKRHDARGLLWVTEDAGAVSLWEFDADQGAIAQRFTASLPPDVAPVAVRSIDAELVLLSTAEGYLAASAALGAQAVPVPGEGLELNPPLFVMAWPDGRGFSMGTSGRGTSVNLAQARALTLGNVTPLGQHITFEGEPSAMTVKVYDNARAQAPDEPIVTWVADFGTGWDSLDSSAEALYEGFGFQDGTCGVARWGRFRGMGSATYVGEVGWPEADTVLYLGPCDAPLSLVSREQMLDEQAFSRRRASPATLKTDHPALTLDYGIRLVDGFTIQSDGLAGFEMRTHGWVFAPDGSAVPLFRDASRWLIRRQGALAWTVHDGALYRADATGEL